MKLVRRHYSLEEQLQEHDKLQCRECEGSGRCECSRCDHEHECGRCDGSGLNETGEDVLDKIQQHMKAKAKEFTDEWGGAKTGSELCDYWRGFCGQNPSAEIVERWIDELSALKAAKLELDDDEIESLIEQFTESQAA